MEWKKITQYPDYEISQIGDVKNIKTGRILKARLNRNQYKQIGLFKNKKQYTIEIHRLVALTFVPNPNNLPIADHKDRNKLNNHFSNLRWVTNSESAHNRILPTDKTGLVWDIYQSQWLVNIEHDKSKRQYFNNIDDAYTYLKVNL